MLNRILIMGRLTRDPELRHTQTGIPVASFALAVDRDFKNKETGERGTDFIDVVAWRNTAEFVSKYFAKGRMAVVEGRLQIRDWIDKEGNKRRSAEVVAENIYFGEPRRDGDPSSNYARPAPYSGSSAYAGAYPTANTTYPAANTSYPGSTSVDYGMPPAGGDQFADLSDDDEEQLPF